MTAWGWLALGVGLWLLGGGSGRSRSGAARRTRRSPPSAGRPHSVGVPPAALRVVGAGAPVVAAVALLGPVRGLVAGALAAPGAVWMIGRVEVRAASGGDDPRLPFCLDLVAAGLRGGRPLGAALSAAAPAASPVTARELERVAGLLRLGADPVEAWRAPSADPVLAPVARVACRSAQSGARLARNLEALAADLRDASAAAAVARAHRAGVRALAPLGACFLPAFLCLGIVPVVVGVARGVFGALP